MEAGPGEEGSVVPLSDAAHAIAAGRGQAAETERLYRADWRAFTAWCITAGLCPLPATPAAVAAFLADAVPRLSPGALTRRAAAIARVHRDRRLPVPTRNVETRAVLRAARTAATPRRAPAPSPARLVRLAAACPRDLRGLRDRALLLLAAAGLGRSALVGVDVEHLRFMAGGVDLSLERLGSEPRQVVLMRGAALRACPVHALEDWLRTSDTQFGPVFRKIDRWGNVEHRRLGPDAIRRILLRRTKRGRGAPGEAQS